MALVVEDGTGMATAESPVTVVEFKTYADSMGHAYPASDDASIEQALRRATRYIDGRYRSRWPGDPTNGRTQALAWPREKVLDGNGEEIESDEIPREYKAAVMEAAVRELASPGSLSPDVVHGTRVRREKVGQLEVEYSGSSEMRPTVVLIDEILDPILTSSGGSSVKWFARA